MCEEYLSSKEIMQKIADLKIRLALQQEFEQEVDELLEKANPSDAGQTQQIRDTRRARRGNTEHTVGRADAAHRAHGLLQGGDRYIRRP